MITSLGHNTFSSDDLKWFANASGDYNPIHLDPVIARRLINGKQTVHGIFVMLFALDRYYQKHAHVPKQIKTYFQKIADPQDIAATAAVAFTINHIAAVSGLNV